MGSWDGWSVRRRRPRRCSRRWPAAGAALKDTVNRAPREVGDRVKRHEARMAAERIAAEALDLDALTDKAVYRPGPAVRDDQGQTA